VYCKVCNSQNAGINENPIYCILAQKIFQGISIEADSKPENNAQPPMDTINNEKYSIPGVFHQRALSKPMVSAIAAVSNEINTSDVNCQVNAKSSVY